MEYQQVGEKVLKIQIGAIICLKQSPNSLKSITRDMSRLARDETNAKVKLGSRFQSLDKLRKPNELRNSTSGQTFLLTNNLNKLSCLLLTRPESVILSCQLARVRSPLRSNQRDVCCGHNNRLQRGPKAFSSLRTRQKSRSLRCAGTGSSNLNSACQHLCRIVGMERHYYRAAQTWTN